MRRHLSPARSPNASIHDKRQIITFASPRESTAGSLRDPEAQSCAIAIQGSSINLNLLSTAGTTGRNPLDSNAPLHNTPVSHASDDKYGMSAAIRRTDSELSFRDSRTPIQNCGSSRISLRFELCLAQCGPGPSHFPKSLPHHRPTSTPKYSHAPLHA